MPHHFDEGQASPRNPAFLRDILRRAGGMSVFSSGERRVRVSYCPPVRTVSHQPDGMVTIAVRDIEFEFHIAHLVTYDRYAYITSGDQVVIEPFRFHGFEFLGSEPI